MRQKGYYKVLAVPPSVQEMEMIDYKRIKDDLIAFEMQAFAELFHFWATDKKSRRKLSKNRERLEYFRKALLGGEYGVHREDVPHELLYDEYQIAKYAVTQARKAFGNSEVTKRQLENYEVPYSIEGVKPSVVIYKPLPISPKPPAESKYPYPLEELAKDVPKKSDKSLTPAKIARKIVGQRFEYSSNTIKKRCNKKYLRHEHEAKTSWRLLATLFLELGAYGDLALQARILDYLLRSGYSRFKLYYLVQVSHSLDSPISLGRCRQSMVEQLCRTVCPTETKGPFARLILGE